MVLPPLVLPPFVIVSSCIDIRPSSSRLLQVINVLFFNVHLGLMYQSISENAFFTRVNYQVGASSRLRDIRENKIGLLQPMTSHLFLEFSSYIFATSILFSSFSDALINNSSLISRARLYFGVYSSFIYIYLYIYVQIFFLRTSTNICNFCTNIYSYTINFLFH